MYKVKFLMGPAECNDKNIPAYSKDFIDSLSKELNDEVVYASISEVAEEAIPIHLNAFDNSLGRLRTGPAVCFIELISISG